MYFFIIKFKVARMSTIKTKKQFLLVVDIHKYHFRKETS